MGLLNRALDPMDILNGKVKEKDNFIFTFISYFYSFNEKTIFKIILFLHEKTIFIYQSKRLKINLFNKFIFNKRVFD